METTNKNMESVSIKRICNCCKETIYIGKNDVNDSIYYDGKTYHRDCFIQICNKRASMKRVDVSEKWSWVLKNLDKVEKDSENHLLSALEKEDVFEFIRNTYGLTTIPSSVFQKLGNIYLGTFRGMSVGIQPKYLVDMWNRKIAYLNKIANNNVTNGKEMQPEQRINYDLSILVNKYDSYMEWLEKQKILEQEIKNENKKTDNLVRKTQNANNSTSNLDNKEDDISELVDDIFI